MKRRALVRFSVFVLFALLAASSAGAQGFPNVARTAGELIAGPIAPEQGRTAIVAWHGERIVTVPEAPGSQPGADVQMRVVDISDPANPQVTLLPAHTSGFHAHAYFHYGAYLYVGPHCLTATLQPCGSTPEPNIYNDSLRIGGAGMAIGGSSLRRASIENETGLLIGGINKSGTQSPWGVEDFWTYNTIAGESFLAVRRNPGDYIYDWANGGAITGPAITATWDHLGQTGVIGFPFIMGNILVYAADMTGSGVATYDISDLSNPVLLDVLKEENPGGYWPEVYGHYIFFPRRDNEGGPGSQAGFMVVDFEDPTDLQVVVDRNLTGSNQYVTFQDEYAFMNRYKIDMRTFEVELTLPTVAGVLDASQFALPVGNLLVTGGYGTDGPGLAIWAHQDAPDTRSPFVLYHVPRPDQTNYSVDCPITLSIPETLRTETIVNGTTLIVQPVGGSPIDTWHAFSQGKLLTVTPQAPLAPDTTYEVILTAGIQDAAGNGLEPYTFRFSTGSGLAGGNQPPSVGAITATPETGTPGATIDLAWSGSDPEAGAIEYRADFGDGSPRTAWGPATSAMHAYAEAGHYQVTVQARDNQGSVAAGSRTITVAPPAAAPGSTASGLVVVDELSGRLFVANPDSDTISAMDSATLAKLWEVPVGAHPRGVSLGSDGTLWVACRDADTIDILDAVTGAALTSLPLDYGARPVAIAPTPGGATMLVSCEGDAALRRFSVATRAETGAVALGPFPRAIAVTADGSRALVTRFISGEHAGQVYDVALAGGMSLTRTISLARDHAVDSSASSRGVPNYLAAVRITPDGLRAWVVGKKDNTTRGTFFSPMMVPGQDNTVRAQLMVIDLSTNAEDLTLRLDIDNSDSPSAVIFSPLGDYGFIALQGNAQVAVVDVLDFMRLDSPGTIHSRWATGLAPQGVALDAASGRLFVDDFMGRSVTALDAGAFLAAGSPNVPSSTVEVVAAERLAPSVLQGKRLFYHASDKRMSAEGYISCATCHVDGSHDGRTFDFTNRGEGFRNTTDLRGRSGMGHGRVHWSANFDEIQDFEGDIRSAFGGTGFLSDGDFAATSDPLGATKAGLDADLDALAAYVTSLGSASLPRSPARAADGTLTAAAQAGQALFASEGCAACHVPATDYTDRLAHDVGTLRASSGQRLGAPLGGIDTPTLLGVHAGAPYFHNGSAATLEEVFSVTGGRMEQAEDGALAGSAAAEDIAWAPMKDWHGSEFVRLDQGGSLTFADVNTTVGGAGFVELRYSSLYGQSQISVTVNGAGPTQFVAFTPGNPNYLPNEWRTLRVPVSFASGANSVVVTKVNAGGEFRVDDIVFSTPDDAAAASAHVRGFTAGQLTEIVAYLQSLDGSNAAAPAVAVVRDGPVAPGGIDEVTVPTGGSDHALIYTIENNGAGPLNLGEFRLTSNPPATIWIERAPATHVLAGASTELELRIATPLTAATAAVSGWTDDATVGNAVAWTVEATAQDLSSVGDLWWMY